MKKLPDKFNYKIIERKGYPYIILPFDYECSPEQINMFADALERSIRSRLDCDQIDKIVTIESKGILISTIVAMRLNKPINIIRKRELYLKDEIKITKSTGYEESYIFINGLDEGMKIVLIDDLISTGGTLTATMDKMIDLKCEILGAFIVFDKIDFGGAQKISDNYAKKHGFPFETIVKLRITEDKQLVVVDDNT